MGLFNFSDEYCDVKPVYDHTKTNYLKVNKLEPHNWAWIGTALCVIVACALSFWLIYKHLRNYTRPEFQKYIIRIILMVPVYAIDSFLSFRFYWVAIYFEIVRDCYEAFVIYTFYSLLIAYMGGYDRAKDVISSRGNVKLVVPLCCVTVNPKRGLIRQLKRLTLQYVIIRPTMTIIAIILHAGYHQYCPGNYSPRHGYVYITIVNFFSVTAAMYALVMFYTLSKFDIAQYKPIAKFLSIKFVIFFCFWQSIAVSGFVAIHGIREKTYWSTDNIATGIQDACVCFEMLVAAIIHIWAFSYKEYDTGKRTNIFRSAVDSFNPVDIAKDIFQSFYPHAYIKKKRTREDSLVNGTELQESKEFTQSRDLAPTKSVTSVEIHLAEPSPASEETLPNTVGEDEDVQQTV